MIFRLLVVFAFLSGSVASALSPATLFKEGAVLQHGKPVPVWGTAEPGQRITVTFAEQSETSITDQDGRWSVTLAPLEPNANPAELVISGEDTIRLRDILVGEVWLASGQSNMAWRIDQSFDADLEVAMANWPSIREFNIPRTAADTPQMDVEGQWVAAEHEAIRSFSAVAYSFARDLHQTLDMPIGIINSSWGGTPVESWTDSASLASSQFSAVHERHQQSLQNHAAAVDRHAQRLTAWTEEKAAAEVAGEAFTRDRPAKPAPPQPRFAPSALYNAMIHPLVPYAFRGAIWYQGESNARRHDEYHDLFSAMITGWRQAFQQGDFPFYWVQLAEFRATGPRNLEWAFLREAQTQTLDLPATGQAVILDISDFNDIHPGNKRDVGRRLARLAFNRAYDHEIVDTGPVFHMAEFDGDSAHLHFTESSGPLRTAAVTLRGFELAGKDRLFHPATAVISGNTVTLTSEEAPEPVAARYAWRNAPEATLSNGAGLPAAPFRTDTWEE